MTLRIMIADLETTEAPLERIARVVYKLHIVKLGARPVVLMASSEGRLFAVFADEYSPALRSFIERCKFEDVSFGDRDIGEALGVVYCRLALYDDFLNLFNDYQFFHLLRAGLGKVFKIGSKEGGA